MGSEGGISWQYLLGSVGLSDALKECIQIEKINTKLSNAANSFFFFIFIS